MTSSLVSCGRGLEVQPTEQTLEQFSKVKNFKKKVSDLGGLYRSYNGSNEFENYLNDVEVVFAHSKVDVVYLEDVFIAPDLRNANEKQSRVSSRIFRDEYASIIMFVTHLSKDEFIIEDLLEKANAIFPETPICKLEEELDQEPPSYDEIGLDDDCSNIDIYARITLALKTIDILGQIARKYWGELDGDRKLELVTTTYNLGLSWRSLRKSITWSMSSVSGS